MSIRISSILLLFLLLFVGIAHAASFAYIANYNDNTVTVLDTSTDTVIATIGVGTRPQGVAVNPAGTKVYVANRGSNTISVIDTATNTVTATVPVGDTPYGVAMNPAGTRVYVTNVLSHTVSVIDTATNLVTAAVPVGTNPYGVALDPSGAQAYVTKLDDSVAVIDTATNTVTTSVYVGDLPWSVVVHPAGTRVYVTEIFGNDVSVIDTATHTVIATVGVGVQPAAVGIHPAGTRIYVVNAASNTLSVIATASNTPIATINVGTSPQGVALNPAGTKAYVVNYGSNTVSIIDTATNAVTATVEVGNGPISLGQFIGPDMPPPIPPEPLNNPPDVSRAYPSAGCLWPPNHKSVEVTIGGVTDPDGDPVTLEMTEITANEPLAPGDVSGVGTGIAKLTAERNGNGNGRKYTIAFTASDGKGEAIPGSVQVCVPHDQREPCTCDGSPELLPTIPPTAAPTPTPAPATPIAAFVATPLSGIAPLEVTFTDQSRNSPTAWYWNFGDGTTSTAQNPVHTYPMHLTGPGVYTVSLTASNVQGSHTLTRPDYISVSLTEVKCWEPSGGAGVFELITPYGSSWKIRGPFGYFGLYGTSTDAPWEPIVGTKACIGTDSCGGPYTVYILGPDGTVKVWELNSLGETCHVVLTY